MKDIFGPEGREALEELAFSNVLLGFDYDGTLAPIVAKPAHAAMRPSTRTLLAEVSRRYPCAVISGRARRDVSRFLDRLPVLSIVGNHGTEWREKPRSVPRATVLRWRREMARRCAEIPGVVIEDKTWSLAVHWRAARPKPAARARVLEAARSIAGARIVRGKEVVNLVHPAAPHKGEAILEVRRQLSCDTVIYVGDDVTDEDVFALARPGRLLAIRVGRSPRSRAPFYLARQALIDELLLRLLSLRPGAAPEAAAFR